MTKARHGHDAQQRRRQINVQNGDNVTVALPVALSVECIGKGSAVVMLIN